jgi:hypothetical protein
METFVDIGLYLSYVLVILAVVSIIVFPVIQAIGDPSGLMKSGVGILAILVVFGIGYVLSGDETEPYVAFGTSALTSKIVGGSLITMYLLGVLSFVAIVYSEVSKMFK